MPSLRALVGPVCVSSVLALALAAAALEVTGHKHASPAPGGGDNTPKGNCLCGGFPSAAIEPGSQPLLSQSPGLVAKCDDEGESTCKQLCVALATAAKAKGPEVLCVRLIDARQLKLSAFSKMCDRPWVYADMTADKELCCADSKVTPCAAPPHPGARAPTGLTNATLGEKTHN